jgi:hypothetical protein
VKSPYLRLVKQWPADVVDGHGTVSGVGWGYLESHDVAGHGGDDGLMHQVVDLDSLTQLMVVECTQFLLLQCTLMDSPWPHSCPGSLLAALRRDYSIAAI